MNPNRDISFGADDHVERLIARHLDGEITPGQQAELDQILAGDPDARAMLSDYRQNDLFAARALRADIGLAGTTPVQHTPRNVWLVATGAVLAAAAVVALSFLPIFNPPADRLTNNVAPAFDMAPPVNRLRPTMISPQFVDYRNVDLYPRQQFSDVHRDLIGIRGPDPNVIFLFERETQATKVVPVSGDF
jgi:hypothetical protein